MSFQCYWDARVRVRVRVRVQAEEVFFETPLRVTARVTVGIKI